MRVIIYIYNSQNTSLIIHKNLKSGVFLGYVKNKQASIFIWWCFDTPLKNMLIRLDHESPNIRGENSPCLLSVQPDSNFRKSQNGLIFPQVRVTIKDI